ncbi:hypothetical protein PR001_g15292 [Phytophthora rubi]|uniref:Uncharacterized protein n=1 Tax=Phytophthora rubi TaxID=129364 RepID=A0A6A3L7G4_9STRA|nr:hypothetical protein PR001_g15292 [Phytophthora rubi]
MGRKGARASTPTTSGAGGKRSKKTPKKAGFPVVLRFVRVRPSTTSKRLTASLETTATTVTISPTKTQMTAWTTRCRISETQRALSPVIAMLGVETLAMMVVETPVVVMTPVEALVTVETLTLVVLTVEALATVEMMMLSMSTVAMVDMLTLAMLTVAMATGEALAMVIVEMMTLVMLTVEALALMMVEMLTVEALAVMGLLTVAMATVKALAMLTGESQILLMLVALWEMLRMRMTQVASLKEYQLRLLLATITTTCGTMPVFQVRLLQGLCC